MISDDYALLDSGGGAKLERFGSVILDRPCLQAIWPAQLAEQEWEKATARFDRREGNRWHRRDALPEAWEIKTAGLVFSLSGTDFGHLGIFPEQRQNWRWISRMLSGAATGAPSLLNLFAYTGGATMAAALAGADVCHLDASRGMVERARGNAAINGLGGAPIRWLTEDVHSFLRREARRGRRYDAVILDPPSFGRGSRGEVYKIERDLARSLELCRALLSPAPLFVLLSSHTPHCGPVVLANMLRRLLPASAEFIVEEGEMLLAGDRAVLAVPSGSWACWRRIELPASTSEEA